MSRSLILMVVFSASVLSTLALIAGAAGAAGEPSVSSEAPSVLETALSEHVRQLDRILQRRLRALERQATDRPVPAPDPEAEIARLGRHLRHLEARAEGLGPAGEETVARIRSLDRLLRTLAQAARRRAEPGDRGSRADRGRGEAPVVRQPVRNGAPGVDACADALPIGNGTFVGTTLGATNDGSASCGLSDVSPDVWFRYSSPVGGRVFADTLGSGYDTVLSAHVWCPGTAFNEWACSDNDLGLQSALGFDIAPGEEILLRLSGFAGDSGPWTLNVGPGGAVSGKVTDAATGEPLTVQVVVFDEQGGYATSTASDPAGNYTAVGLATGSYFVVAGGDTLYIAEVYADLPCPDTACDPTAGTPVEVTQGTVTGGVDFSLDLGGTLAGTVTDSATGDPIRFVQIEVLGDQGDEVARGVTGADGRYAVEGLAAGSYFVRAESFEHRDEIYDDLPCPDFYSCVPTGGEKVAVEVGTTTGGIDFALDPLSSISGLVTDAVTGEPIPYAGVSASSGSGFFEFGMADETGSYAVGGLSAGSYFVNTQTFGYRDEIYDDLPCLPFDCDPSVGAAVAVAFGADTPGIDFALDPLGSISGTVTEAASGDPIPFASVGAQPTGEVFTTAYAQADALGRYSLETLFSDDWVVYTRDNSGYQDELYDDIPCPNLECDLASGTPVAVSVATESSGIDFALDPLGSISGRVTDAATGDPIAVSRVEAHQVGSVSGFSGFAWTDSQGRYTVSGLGPGTYFVRTDATRHQNEVYDDVACPFGGCDLAAATPVAVAAGAATEGIDFALDPLGSISGRVTDAATGNPLFFVNVEVLDATLGFVGAGFTDGTGRYEVPGLAAGTYFAVTQSEQHRDELYDDVPCDPDCDLASGTPVAVSAGAETSGVDFSLVPYGSISGTVTDAATGEPVAFFDVRAQSADGLVDRFAQTDMAGEYTITGLPAGAYRATAVDFDDSIYVGERYDGVPCPRQSCDPAAGTPIAVSFGGTTPGIDFSLERGATIAGTVTDAVTGRLASAQVGLWDAGGALLEVTSSAFDGRYVFPGLPAGTYFVTAGGGAVYAGELYDGLPCPPGCDPTVGTPVAVAAGGLTADVDFALVPAAPTCVPNPFVLCLGDGRFRVDVEWRDFLGETGTGRAVSLTSDTGYFWFFGADNIELVVKVLDACELAGFDNFWVFAAGLTDVGTVLTVTDTVSGEVRTYTHALGTPYEPIQDTAAFATCPAGAGEGGAGLGPAAGLRELEALLTRPEAVAEARRGPGSCVTDAETLCLNGDRFAVRASWETPLQESGEGRAVRLSADTGYFWFFDADNVEAVVKVLDACDLDPFDNFWVFAAGLTDVRVTLEVTDTVSGETQEWINPQGTAYRPITETGLFRTCP